MTKREEHLNIAEGIGLLDDAIDDIWPSTASVLAEKEYTIISVPGKATALLGAGEFASTFLFENKYDKKVAIKLYRRGFEDVKYFRNELEILKNPLYRKTIGCEHCDASCVEGSQPFIVLEYIPGTAICEHVNKVDLSRDGILELIIELSRGVHELHEIGWAHRDIHEKNVIVAADDGKIRLVDFGSAGPTVYREKTIPVCGHGDSAPEVRDGSRRPDDKSDVWDVAALAILLLTKKPMPRNEQRSGDETHLRRCRKHLGDNGISSALSEILLKGLQSHSNRCSAQEFANKIADWRRTNELRPKRRMIAAAAITMMTICALLVTVVILTIAAREQRGELDEIARLKEEFKTLEFRDHEPLAGTKNRVTEMEKSDGHLTDTERDSAILLLKQAITDNRTLLGQYERIERFGSAIQTNPWAVQAKEIARTRQAIERKYLDAKDLLSLGQLEEASVTLDELQKDLATLTSLNADAQAAVDEQTRFLRVSKSVCARLRLLPRFDELVDLAKSADSALDAGQYLESKRLYGQAFHLMGEWLDGNETPKERADREAEQFVNIAPIQTVSRDPLPTGRPQEFPKPLIITKTVIGSELVRVPGGTFQMGSPLPLEQSDELGHTVRITGPLLVGKTETTNRDFRRLLTLIAEGTAKESDVKLANMFLQRQLSGDDFPVTDVTYFDAIWWLNKLSEHEGLAPVYIFDPAKIKCLDGSIVAVEFTFDFAKTGYRLPTEAEWEYVCRAGTSTEWNCGDELAELRDHAWFANNSRGALQIVGTKYPNGFGVCDMHGNVWEWCHDWHNWSYYTNSPEHDPVGPKSGKARVLRGGSWAAVAQETRSAFRFGVKPILFRNDIGFRMVRLAH